jgi:hypothetical protein
VAVAYLSAASEDTWPILSALVGSVVVRLLQVVRAGALGLHVSSELNKRVDLGSVGQQESFPVLLPY